jgi:hypothetical protein
MLPAWQLGRLKCKNGKLNKNSLDVKGGNSEPNDAAVMMDDARREGDEDMTDTCVGKSHHKCDVTCVKD